MMIREAELGARLEEKTAYTILVRKPEGKRQFGRLRR
jgi:hypothetical protein